MALICACAVFGLLFQNTIPGLEDCEFSVLVSLSKLPVPVTAFDTSSKVSGLSVPIPNEPTPVMRALGVLFVANIILVLDVLWTKRLPVVSPACPTYASPWSLWYLVWEPLPLPIAWSSNPTLPVAEASSINVIKLQDAICSSSSCNSSGSDSACDAHPEACPGNQVQSKRASEKIAAVRSAQDNDYGYKPYHN